MGEAGTAGEPLLGLRDFIDTGESSGELRGVPGAPGALGIGGTAELSSGGPPPNALLFTDVPGYGPGGGRVLTGSTSSARRLGHILRLGDDLDDAALVAALRGKP